MTVVAGAGRAPGQTWSGAGGNGNWSTGANWVGNTPPASGTTTAVTLAGTTNLTTNQDVANPLTLNSLTFAAGAGAFTVGGNALSFDGTTPSITQSSSANQSVTA